MQQIRNYLEKLYAVNENDWQYFLSKLKKRIFKKRVLMIKAGEIENHISFIEKGVVRLIIPHEELEKEITFGFSFENEFISAYDSFLTQKPSNYNLETLTDTIVWSLTYSDLQDVYSKTEIGNAIGRYYAEKLFLIKSKREQDLLNETAEQRYLKLFTERPNLLKEIPLKYIASYIGVTPQALSRIRARIS